MSDIPLFDIFQPGLHRGSAQLPFDPKKSYAYVEHPTEGWRVYLRACAFLHREGEPIKPSHFLVVKRSHTRMQTPSWEPPKGQMEGKEMKKGVPIISLLRKNIEREIYEESHITQVERLRHTGLVFQSQESSYPPHHYFQYHVFQGFLKEEQIQQSETTFAWMKDHPLAVARWSRDRKEKDAVSWFHPRVTRLNPRWTPDIVSLYVIHCDAL
jgi:hypothetical protein